MKKIPTRVGVAAMIFMTTFTTYTLRTHFSVSLVAMVQLKDKKFVPECLRGKKNDTDQKKMKMRVDYLTGRNSYQRAIKDVGTRYEWNDQVEASLLAAYFYGFIVSCAPSGIVVETIGPWNTIFYTTIISAVFTLLAVPGAALNWGAVYACRVGVGLCSGFVYPALHNVIAHWAPPFEKGRFVACLMGNTIGMVVTQPMVGFLTERLHDWAYGFYYVAVVSLLFCIPWWFLVSDTPQKHRWISDEERQFIEESQQGIISKKKRIAPYKRVLSSCPCWALFFCHFGDMWGLILTQSNGPKYMAQVLGFDLKASGGLASVPYLGRLAGGVFFGVLGDVLRKRTSLTITKIRKGAIIYSHFIPGVLMAGLLLAGCNWMSAVVLLVLSLGFNGAVCLGHLQNIQDLAPNYVATISGIMALVGGSPGLFLTYITAALTNKNNSVSEWGYVFFLGGCAYFGGGAIFLMFGSGELQSWNNIPDDPDTATVPE